MNIERRIYQVPDIEYRVHGEGDESKPVVSGLGVPYGSETVIGDMWREEFVDGAFREAIAEDDIRSLFNHEPSIIFGRNRAGTLDLEETPRGVVYTARPDVNPTTEGPLRNIERKEVTGSSFGFAVRNSKDEEWSDSDDGKLPLRRIFKARMFDIGPVTFPAYPQTDAMVRSLLEGSPGMPVEVRDGLLEAVNRSRHAPFLSMSSNEELQELIAKALDTEAIAVRVAEILAEQRVKAQAEMEARDRAIRVASL